VVWLAIRQGPGLTEENASSRIPTHASGSPAVTVSGDRGSRHAGRGQISANFVGPCRDDKKNRWKIRGLPYRKTGRRSAGRHPRLETPKASGRGQSWDRDLATIMGPKRIGGLCDSPARGGRRAATKVDHGRGIRGPRVGGSDLRDYMEPGGDYVVNCRD